MSKVSAMWAQMLNGLWSSINGNDESRRLKCGRFSAPFRTVGGRINETRRFIQEAWVFSLIINFIRVWRAL